MLPATRTFFFDYTLEDLVGVFGVEREGAVQALIAHVEGRVRDELLYEGHNGSEAKEYQVDYVGIDMRLRVVALRSDGWKDVSRRLGQQARWEFGQWEEEVIGSNHPAHTWEGMSAQEQAEARRLFQEGLEDKGGAGDEYAVR